VNPPPVEELRAILARFGVGTPASITSLSGGHINQSWKVVPGSRFEVEGAPAGNSEPRTWNFLLQRLNQRVFPDGARVMRNVAAVCDHLWRAAARLHLPEPERRVLRLFRTPEGEPSVQGADGAWWRLLGFIENARAVEQAGSPAVAGEAGRAFGLFQRLLADYDGPVLVETIPGFHDTTRRIADLEAVARRDPRGRAGEVVAELGFASRRREYAGVLPALIASGALPRRVVHNDAKIANVLLDSRTGEALAVVDLDTVMPGTLLSDAGDLIRSIASPTPEDERDLDRIGVSSRLVEPLVAGFLEGCGGVPTETERRLLVFAGILLTYEQGVRFLTDYLEGDVYYRVTRPGQNLDRARAQFRLVECLEAERAPLERRVAEIVRRGEVGQ
jgi:hypothetical protein